MSDGLPTEEQLRRIERGVRARIDLRRRVARNLAGAAAGVLLLGGGLALLVPHSISATSGGSTAGGAGSAAGSSAKVAVRCHLDGGTTATTAPDAPERIAAACGADVVEFQRDQGRVPSSSDAPSAASADRPVVLCRARDGVVDVYPAGDRPTTVCERRSRPPY